jgi:hypothetical protein
MKIVENCAFQGDIMIRRVEKLPEGVTKQKDLVVTHSETGHNHVAVGKAERWQKDGMLSYLVAKGPVKIEHHRPWDTHETLELLYDGGPEVVWEIRRQREHAPEGWRRVED